MVSVRDVLTYFALISAIFAYLSVFNIPLMQTAFPKTTNLTTQVFEGLNFTTSSLVGTNTTSIIGIYALTTFFTLSTIKWLYVSVKLVVLLPSIAATFISEVIGNILVPLHIGSSSWETPIATFLTFVISLDIMLRIITTFGGGELLGEVR